MVTLQPTSEEAGVIHVRGGAKMSDMRNQDPWKWLILRGMNRMLSVCDSCVKELGRN